MRFCRLKFTKNCQKIRFLCRAIFYYIYRTRRDKFNGVFENFISWKVFEILSVEVYEKFFKIRFLCWKHYHGRNQTKDVIFYNTWREKLEGVFKNSISRIVFQILSVKVYEQFSENPIFLSKNILFYMFRRKRKLKLTFKFNRKQKRIDEQFVCVLKCV